MNKIKYNIFIAFLILMVFQYGCSVAVSRMSNEKRIAIEYLNSSARSLQSGRINEAIIYIEGNYNYIVQTDDYGLNTRYITTILKILNLYGMHEISLEFLENYMKSIDYINSDISTQRSMKFLYIDTLIRNNDFDTSKSYIQRLFEDRDYNRHHLNILHAYNIMLYRFQRIDFTDDALIQNILAQRSDDYTRMVLIKNLALYYFEMEYYQRALTLFLMYNNFVRDVDYTSEIALSYAYLARIYYNIDKFDQSKYCFYKSYYIYHSKRNFYTLYPILNEFLEIASSMNDKEFKEAIQYRLESNRSFYKQDLIDTQNRNQTLLDILDRFSNLL